MNYENGKKIFRSKFPFISRQQFAMPKDILSRCETNSEAER